VSGAHCGWRWRSRPWRGKYYLSLAIGGAQILPDDEIARVVEKFKNYGPKSKPTAPKKAAAKAKPAAKKTAKRKK
jgi:hypothetical protein